MIEFLINKINGGKIIVDDVKILVNLSLFIK